MGKGIRTAKSLNRFQPFTKKARGSVRNVKERLRLETMNGLRAMGAPLARVSKQLQNHASAFGNTIYCDAILASN